MQTPISQNRPTSALPGDLTSTECLEHPFDAITENDLHRYCYSMSESVYEGFLSVFGDTNPLHVDTEAALSAGFDGRVMHGAILNGFHSHFIGMRFPGRNAILLSAHFNYLLPSYLGDTIEVTAKVKHRNESQKVLLLALEFKSVNRQVVVARAQTMVKVRA